MYCGPKQNSNACSFQGLGRGVLRRPRFHHLGINRTVVDKFTCKPLPAGILPYYGLPIVFWRGRQVYLRPRAEEMECCSNAVSPPASWSAFAWGSGRGVALAVP